MVDGLWTVEFISTLGLSGTGVIVLSGGRLLGGDPGYYYSGNYKLAQTRISGKLNVIRYNPNIVSIFGDIDYFSLKLNGRIIEGNSIDAIAELETMPDMRIQLKCRKKEDL